MPWKDSPKVWVGGRLGKAPGQPEAAPMGRGGPPQGWAGLCCLLELLPAATVQA